MDQQQIARINELARKSRTPEGLTEEEKAEQAALRQAYLQASQPAGEYHHRGAGRHPPSGAPPHPRLKPVLPAGGRALFCGRALAIPRRGGVY